MTVLCPPHLGGHEGTTHEDDGALDSLVQRFAPATAIDLGCGPGGMLKLMRQRGIRCYGIDGDPTIATGKILTHDFNTGPLDIEPVDLCWSVEFLEHVAERFLVNVWPVIEQCRVVFCTHALPAERFRRRHVNCQPAAYWLKAFAAHGFDLDIVATAEVRHHSTMERDFVRQTGKVFVRNAEGIR